MVHSFENSICFESIFGPLMSNFGPLIFGPVIFNLLFEFVLLYFVTEPLISKGLFESVL